MYQHTSYKQKYMKIKLKMTVERVQDKKTAKLEKQIQGLVQALVGNGTTQITSLDHDSVFQNDTIAHPDAILWKKAIVIT